MNAPLSPHTTPPSASADAPDSPDERSTGLPLFRTWPAVYLFVVGCFALWVAILALLPRIFA